MGKGITLQCYNVCLYVCVLIIQHTKFKFIVICKAALMESVLKYGVMSDIRACCVVHVPFIRLALRLCAYACVSVLLRMRVHVSIVTVV